MRLFRHPKEVIAECRGGAVADRQFRWRAPRPPGGDLARRRAWRAPIDQPLGRADVRAAPTRRSSSRICRRSASRRSASRCGCCRRWGFDFVCCLAFDRQLASMTAPEFAEGVLRDALQVRHIVVGEDFCFGKGRSGDVSVLKTLGASLDFKVDGDLGGGRWQGRGPFLDPYPRASAGRPAAAGRSAPWPRLGNRRPGGARAEAGPRARLSHRQRRDERPS